MLTWHQAVMVFPGSVRTRWICPFGCVTIFIDISKTSIIVGLCLPLGNQKPAFPGRVLVDLAQVLPNGGFCSDFHLTIQAMKDDVLTTTETAKILGISVRTAQLLIEDGAVPSWKTPGGHRRVHRSAVEALLRQSRVSPKMASATVMVVTSLRRQPSFQHSFQDLGHLFPHFYSDIWSAAIAVGARAPAAVVIDWEVWRGEATSFLVTLASSDLFRDADLVVATRAREDRLKALPKRVHQVPIDELPSLLAKLTHEKPSPIDRHSPPPAPMAPNEASRLLAVKRSGIVDTPAEPSFDRVTWLAATGLNSPVALMTVLTEERQWFKSRHGLAMPETPRSWAFCNQTILQKGVFEVRDLVRHPAFASNPAVAASPHFRFYAGAPVFDPDGFPLGSICVIDYRPRQLNSRQRQMLLDLAAVASDEVKLRELLAKAH